MLIECRETRLGDLVKAASAEILETAGSIAFFEEDVVLRFSAVTNEMFDRMELARQESKKLPRIGHLLLPKLISGELRVKDADKVVERAV